MKEKVDLVGVIKTSFGGGTRIEHVWSGRGEDCGLSCRSIETIPRISNRSQQLE